MSSLAASQADGYYIPPEYDGKKQKVGISKFNANSKGSSAFARFGTVRFELPFDSWCLKCDAHMNRGLRFNAKKVKAGKYFSTNIFSFSMNCATCKGEFVIRTDPANADYEFVSGIKKQEYEFEGKGEKNEGDDEHVGSSSSISVIDNSIAKLNANERNPMAIMERNNEQKRVVDLHAERMTRLMDLKDATAKHDFIANASLRKKNRQRRTSANLAIKEGKKRGIGVPLAELQHSDTLQAQAMVAMGREKRYEEQEKRRMEDILCDSLGSASNSTSNSTSDSSKHIRSRKASRPIDGANGIKKRKTSSSSSNSNSNISVNTKKKEVNALDALNMYSDSDDG